LIIGVVAGVLAVLGAVAAVIGRAATKRKPTSSTSPPVQIDFEMEPPTLNTEDLTTFRDMVTYVGDNGVNWTGPLSAANGIGGSDGAGIGE
jgi:hypothetical protein